MDFRLSAAAIDPPSLIAGLADGGAGAWVTFEGRVRDENEGRKVTSLDYEAYAPLAEKEGGRVVGEAKDRFQILGAACVHRTGSLPLGEIAVWVAVAAAHRADAFAACRFIIDEVKARVPIWKKEHYGDGSSEWILCSASPSEGSGTDSPGP